MVTYSLRQLSGSFRPFLFLEAFFLSLFLGLLFLVHCQSLEPLSPPTFDYPKLAERYFRAKPKSHFPLTIQREVNLHPSSSRNGYLFYTSTVGGSGDIWVRDLKNTTNLPLVTHPAEQYKASANARGDRMVFVSEDKDENGDLRFLALDPERISQQYLSGVYPPNLWDDSYDLSYSIREWSSKNLPSQCHGDFLETDPDLNAQGDQLLFISDRCTPGTHNIWLAKLEDEELQELKQLTKLSASSPRFAPAPDENRVVFVSYRNQKKGGRIYLLDLKSEALEKIELPLAYGPKGNFIYSSPDFLGKANIIVYSSIRKDTNQNASLDSGDHSGIYSISFKEEVFSFSLENLKKKENFSSEKQLLEDSAILHGLSYSVLLRGSVFYTASLYNNINTYFIPAKGIIPIEKSIEEQYELSRYYLIQNEKRYFMAQKAVLDHHRNDPKYRHYKAKILLDRLEYYRQKKENESLKETKRQIEEALGKDAFIALHYGLYLHKQKASDSRALAYLLDFQKKLSSQKSALLSAKEARFLQLFLKHKLAEEYKNTKQFSKALEGIKDLNSRDLNYPFRKEALFLQLEIEFELNQDFFPPILSTLLKEAKRADLESIHRKVYELYSNRPILGQSPRKIQTGKKSILLEPILQQTFQLLHAQRYLKEAKYKKALDLALGVQAAIPKRRSAFRFLPKEGWSGLYTNSWLIVEKCYRKLSKPMEAFSALIEIISSYNKLSRIRLENSRFRELIRYAEQLDSHLAITRSLARKYRKYKKEKRNENKYLASVKEFIKSSGPETIELSGPETLELNLLCSEFDRNNVIFQSLSLKYVRLRAEFCGKNRETLRQKSQISLDVKEVYKAIDLSYTILYTNARILNLVFFNMRRLGILNEVYEKSSIYFRRLEVDMVSERNKQLLDTLEQNILLDLLLGESDSYVLGSFSEIEKNYRLLFKQMVFAHDLSALYGYAYALIKKNLDRESFHTNLQKKGQIFSSTYLQKHKKKKLHELKNAEYLLRYILNVDPQDVDAYLLLGWLLQYIDQGKKNIVRYSANIWKNFLGESHSTEEDKKFYENLYSTYFPGNYYEENVALYRQALERMKGLPLSPEALGQLHLNLANNYFILKNFKEAAKHYRRVLRSFRDREIYGFQNQKQEILFYFNFARALMYENAYDKAIAYLKKCYTLYQKNDYIPLKKDYAHISFISYSKALQSLTPELLSPYSSRLKDVERKLKETRRRLALIAALTGLAYWQARDSKKAIFYYHKADHHLYQEKPELPEVLSRSNLLNFLALAYQDIGQLKASDRYAVIAEQNAKKAGLGRNEDIYEAKEYCGKALGCFLGFGEDFSVVGEGRNPYGFAPLRQYELALSIQLENRIRADEFAQANSFIKKQRQVFYEHDIDLQHGQKGYLNTLNKEGLHNYKAGAYQKAAVLFLEAAQKAYDFSNMESYRINYANHFNSVLSYLEHASPEPQEAIQQIEEALEEWADFEALYREEIRENFITEKRSEFYGYQFDPKRDGVFLEERIQQDLAYMFATKAIFLYYDAHFRDQKSLGSPQEKGQSIREEAISLLKGVLENIEDKRNSLKAFRISCRYNLARLYFASGYLYSARDLLEKTIRDAYEFHLFREEVILRLLASQVYRELHALYQSPEDEARSLYHMENLLDLFFSKAYLYEDLQNDADKITRSAVRFFIKLGDEGKALQVLEQSWRLYLDWQYFLYDVDFKERIHEKLYKNIRKKRQLLRALDERKYILRLRAKKTDELVKTESRLIREMQRDRSSLRRLSPRHRAFLSFGDWKTRLEGPRLAKGQVLIRFFVGPDFHNSAWCFSSQKRRFFSYPHSEEIEVKALSSSRSFWDFSNSRKKQIKKLYAKSALSLIKQCLQSQSKKGLESNASTKDIFLVLTEELKALNFYQIIKSIDTKLPPPIFSTGLNEKFLGRASPLQKLREEKKLRIFNAGPIPLVLRPYASSAVQEAQLNTDRYTLAKLWRKNHENKTLSSQEKEKPKNKKANILQIVSTNPQLALLLLKGKKEEHSYKKTALLYEILRSRGIGTLVLALGKNTMRIEELEQIAGKRSYAQEGLRVFGFPGFEGRAFQELIPKKYEALSLLAEEAEKEKQYKKARQLHLLAASYLARHPHALKFSQKSALALLRLEILSKPSGSYIKTMDDLLSLARREQKKDFEKAIYKNALHALAKAKAPVEISLRYLEEQQKYFPKSQTQFNETRRGLRFISRLEQNQYALGDSKKQDFAMDFLQAYPYLKKQRAPQVIEKLIKHSQYAASEKLLKDWKKKGKEKSFQAELEDLELSIIFSRFLLDKAPLDFSLPIFSPLSMQKRHPYLQMLYAAWRGKWEKYINLAKKRSQNSRQHMYLYKQWQNYLRQGELDIRYLNEFQQNKEEPFYIRFLERSLLYHLLTHSLELDSAGQNAVFLETLIKEEAQISSVNRMAEIALYAAEKYMRQGDFFPALHFFHLYRKAEKNSIFLKENAYRSARLGAMLYSTGLGADFFKYHKQWRKNLESKSPYDLFLLAFFEAFRAKNLESKIEALNANIRKASEKLSLGNFWNFQKNRGNNFLQDLDISLKLLQWEALRKEKWPILVNLAFLEEELSHLKLNELKNSKKPLPLYQDHLSRLQKRIPLQQNFIGLAEANDTILRFIIKKDDAHVFPLEESAQSLQAKMNIYLRRKALGLSSYKKIEEELTLLYRNVLGYGSPRLTYLWLPGIHSLAPLHPKKEEKFFQVLHIQNFLKYPLLYGAQKLRPDFRIEPLGQRRFDGMSKKEKYLASKLYSMEKLVLSSQQRKSLRAAKTIKKEKGFAKVYHIFSNLNNRNRDNFISRLIPAKKPIRGKPALAHSPWFLSSNFLRISTPEQIKNYNSFLRKLSYSFRAPGIILLQKPPHWGHAYFVRHFYDKSIGLRNIAERFANAYSLIEEDKTRSLRSQGRVHYRLLTSSFLGN